MRALTRAGWTLPEMAMSLAVMGVVAALASHASVAQMRFFDGVGEIVGARGQATEVGAIVAAVLADVTPADGDILVALDSALEVRQTTGVAVVCGAEVGRITVAAPASGGATLASFVELPRAGDTARVIAVDSTGGSFNVTVDAAWATRCPGFGAGDGIAFPTREPVLVPVGSVVRFRRRLRLNTYRASDNRWYFGVKDWNDEESRLNTVQPVAGPLAPFSGSGSRSGLRFRYFTADGAELVAPFDPASVARVAVTVRAESRRPVRVDGLAGSGSVFADSVLVDVALRNTRD